MRRFIPAGLPEFESRQMAFDFGAACRFVAELAASVKATLGKWWKTNRPTLPAPVLKAWKQLVLPSDDIHQLNLMLG